MAHEKLVWSDGSIFFVTFKIDNIEEYEMYEWKNDRSYEGEWKHNKLNGFILV